MNNGLVKQIIEDAAKLAEQSISAFEAQKKLAEIEPEFQTLSKKAHDLEKKAAKDQEDFRSNANKVANILVTRGILEDANKVAFVNTIVDEPSEVFNVLEKIAGELRADNFGSADERPSARDLDAFERLALE